MYIVSVWPGGRVPPRETVPAAANGRRGNGNGLTVARALNIWLGQNFRIWSHTKFGNSAGPSTRHPAVYVVVRRYTIAILTENKTIATTTTMKTTAGKRVAAGVHRRMVLLCDIIIRETILLLCFSGFKGIKPYFRGTRWICRVSGKDTVVVSATT